MSNQESLGIITAEIIHALFGTIGSLRRCLTKVRKKDESDHLSTCYRTATWSKKLRPDASVYSCDTCMVMFARGEGDNFSLDQDQTSLEAFSLNGHPWVEAPHARLVRAFETDLLSLVQHHPLISPRDTRTTFITHLNALIHALPPCPQPLSDTTVCPRCLWADGPGNLDSYRAKLALGELDELAKKLIDEPNNDEVPV